MVDNNQQSTLNTPLDSFGTPAEGPSNNVDHRARTRPADAGHVWGTPDQVKAKLGPFLGGELTTRPPDPVRVEVKPQPPVQLDRAPQNPETEQVSNVGNPDTILTGNTQVDLLPGAVATDADNTVGARPYTPAQKAEAKRRVNVPS